MLIFAKVFVILWRPIAGDPNETMRIIPAVADLEFCSHPPFPDAPFRNHIRSFTCGRRFRRVAPSGSSGFGLVLVALYF